MNGNIVEKHVHHIEPKYLIGEDNSPDNLTPPISIKLHASLHKDLYEHFGNTEDFVAYRMLLGLSLKGCLFTPELREKISNSLKGKKPSEETRKKMSESHKGLKHSEETKTKIGKSSKGNKGRTGQPMSEKSKKKISETKKNKMFAPDMSERRFPGTDYNPPMPTEILIPLIRSPFPPLCAMQICGVQPMIGSFSEQTGKQLIYTLGKPDYRARIRRNIKMMREQGRSWEVKNFNAPSKYDTPVGYRRELNIGKQVNGIEFVKEEL
jgi:hypothetical protein